MALHRVSRPIIIMQDIANAFSYLNGKCEEEGLYRVSGGLSNVRKWRKKFDTGELNTSADLNVADWPQNEMSTSLTSRSSTTPVSSHLYSKSGSESCPRRSSPRHCRQRLPQLCLQKYLDRSRSLSHSATSSPIFLPSTTISCSPSPATSVSFCHTNPRIK